MSSEAYLEQVGGSPRAEIIKPERKTKWREDMPFPEEWVADGYAYLKKHGKPRINVRLELHRFIGKALSNGYRYINWKQAFRNWLISPFCKGEPELEPRKNDPNVEHAIWRCRMALQGKRTQNFSRSDVETALAQKAVTPEEAKRLGFHIDAIIK